MFGLWILELLLEELGGGGVGVAGGWRRRERTARSLDPRVSLLSLVVAVQGPRARIAAA